MLNLWHQITYIIMALWGIVINRYIVGWASESFTGYDDI